MQLYRQTFLLFILNLLDGVLTIYWVHNGFASESNQLMARLLEVGYVPFLAVKIAVGAIASLVLWHWGNFSLARYGLLTVLTIYIGLMGVHFITGLSAFGVISESAVNDFSSWSSGIFAFLS